MADAVAGMPDGITNDSGTAGCTRGGAACTCGERSGTGVVKRALSTATATATDRVTLRDGADA